MKDIQLNKLDQNQRRLLRWGVVLILILFLGIYFFLQWDRKQLANSEVFLEDNQLHVFRDTYTFDGYPDKILLHYPYFMYVQGNKAITTVYNLETREKEKEYSEILLDYYVGNIVYNKQETYFNDQKLSNYCDAAFVQSEQSILCITKESRDFVDNVLIDINPNQPDLWKQVYRSDNILTTVSVINSTLYIGEINFETKQNFLSINQNTTPVDDVVGLVYPLNGDSYFVSFKSELNNNTQSYYLITEGKARKVEDKIYFYK